MNSLLDHAGVSGLILDRVRSRTPFNFIRLGDGEGALSQFSDRSTLEDIAYLQAHFGPHLSGDLRN